MRKKLLLSLMVGALPFLGIARDNPVPSTSKTQLHFLENKGQVVDQFHNKRTDIQFSVPSGNMNVFIGNGQIHYQFSRLENPDILSKSSFKDIRKKKEAAKISMYRMDVELVGANKNASVIKEEEQNYVARFYDLQGLEKNKVVKGKEGMVAKSYERITYQNVYPNIDWVMYIKDSHVEYEFVVKPGGNPANIKLKYGGASSLKVNEDGSLTATTPMGTVTENTPFSFQSDGKKVNSSFKLEGDVLSFNVGSYQGILTIDPTLTWGTFYGDVGFEVYNSVAFDGTNSVYALGTTSSVSNIATTNGYQQALGGSFDMLLSKFDAAGVLQWTTYYGDVNTEEGYSISYDPTTNGVLIGGYSDFIGDPDVLVATFSSAGALQLTGIVGGLAVADDYCTSVTTDASGNLYIAGYTEDMTFWGSAGTQQSAGGGFYDAFLLKMNSAGTSQWSTYCGGTEDDVFFGVKADATGNIYCVGTTASANTGNVIATTGQTTLGGFFDAMVVKYNTSGIRLWGTYRGGGNDDQANLVDVDASGNAYVTGWTFSSNGISSSGTVYQPNLTGTINGFLSAYTASGSVSFSTYFGTGFTEAYAIDVNTTGILIGGLTSSTTLPNTGAYQSALGGGDDGFMAKFTLTGGFEWGSYYGGSSSDYVNSIASEPSGTYFFVSGYSESNNNITGGSVIEQPNNAGGGEAFLSRFLDCNIPAQPGAISGANPACDGSSETYTIAAVTGATSYTWTLPSGWTGTSTTNTINTTVGTTGGAITVTANNACGSSATQTLNVTVNPIPLASITPSGTTTFCQGNNVVLNANAGTGYTYEWFNGTTSVGTGSSYTATTSGSYTVEVTAGGCSATSGAVTVTVNPVPATPTASANVPCVGSALNLTASSTTAGVTYDWTGPNNFPNTQNPTIANAALSDAGVYTVTATLNGCSSSAQVTVTVASGAPATPSNITGDASVCAGSTETYSVINDPNASQYTWTLSSGWSGTSTTNTINATAGTIDGVIIVTATNGCGTSGSTAYTVIVNPLPTPVITLSGGTLSTTATFASYQWYNGAGPISGATSQNYTPTATGDYYVIVTDANGCTGQSNTLNVPVSVNSLYGKATTVTLYPNPNTGSFTIEGAFIANDGKVNVEVVDIAGRVVHKQQLTVSSNNINNQINMNATLAPGVYSLKLNSDVSDTVIPFVKK